MFVVVVSTYDDRMTNVKLEKMLMQILLEKLSDEEVARKLLGVLKHLKISF